MSTTTLTALKQSSWLRPKYLLFAAIGLMLAYVIPHDESFLAASEGSDVAALRTL